MKDDDRLKRAIEDLQREQNQVERLRRDYDTIARSRFFALRMLWQSLKAMFGARLVTQDTAAVAAPKPAEAVRPGISAKDVIGLWRDLVKAHGTTEVPVVSVVIPVFNHLDDTLRCLQSIAQTWPAALATEIIVVDDGSTDDSATVLPRISGVAYARNERNQGFITACNNGARIARGRYICFLNNDTIVRRGWLEALVATAERDESIGAVGAKLLYPNGTLQEAGGIIWSDGSGWNYGKNRSASDAKYNYLRDVDYCSGAALLVDRDLFESLRGFSTDFAPAYYEDADLCFAIRESGRRVVYQPRAEVVHLEGVTSGTDIGCGVKRSQELNRPKFVKKWKKQLESHLPGDPTRVEEAARRLVPRPRVLIVDSYVPLYDKEAGSNRLMHIVKLLRREGLGVVFLPDNYAALQPYTAELQELGVEVLYHGGDGRSATQALEDVLPFVDVAWLCRPELFAKYEPLVRRRPEIRVLYDTIDLHFIRKRREYETLGTGEDQSAAYEKIELDAARRADCTIVVSQPEQTALAERGIADVRIIPTIHDPQIRGARQFDASYGLLFIGNYNHAPNADAVEWLVREIMPRVWSAIPDVTLTLLGANASKAVQALASDRVIVPGYVPDISPYFLKARVFVAPLRFGAGLKGKLGEALSYGLPIVATEVATEGFDLRHDIDCVIAGTPAEIAAGIVQLHQNERDWDRLSNAGLRTVERFGSANVGTRLSELFRDLSLR